MNKDNLQLLSSQVDVIAGAATILCHIGETSEATNDSIELLINIRKLREACAGLNTLVDKHTNPQKPDTNIQYP